MLTNTTKKLSYNQTCNNVMHIIITYVQEFEELITSRIGTHSSAQKRTKLVGFDFNAN